MYVWPTNNGLRLERISEAQPGKLRRLGLTNWNGPSDSKSDNEMTLIIHWLHSNSIKTMFSSNFWLKWPIFHQNLSKIELFWIKISWFNQKIEILLIEFLHFWVYNQSKMVVALTYFVLKLGRQNRMRFVIQIWRFALILLHRRLKQLSRSIHYVGAASCQQPTLK